VDERCLENAFFVFLISTYAAVSHTYRQQISVTPSQTTGSRGQRRRHSRRRGHRFPTACQSSANEAQDLLCTVYSVLRIAIFPHTIVPESTTVASFAAQLRFDRKDEDEDVDLYPAWNRLDEKETRQQQTASIGIIGTLGKTLSRNM